MAQEKHPGEVSQEGPFPGLFIIFIVVAAIVIMGVGLFVLL